MFARSAFRIVLGILIVGMLLATAGALAWTAYEAGLAQGVAQSGAALPAEHAVVPLYPYGPLAFYPFGYGLLGCVVPLLFVVLLFSALRFLFWGRMMHFGPPGGGGDWSAGRDGWRHRCRERAEEWHRHLHAAQAASTPKEPTHSE
jgi:hypothetical protein